MDADFLDLVQDALDESVDLVGDVFTIGTAKVAGDFDEDGEDLTLSTSGGQEYKYGGTLVIPRRRLAQKPAVQSIILGPDGTPYRIHEVLVDDAAWTLTLTHPNARK